MVNWQSVQSRIGPPKRRIGPGDKRAASINANFGFLNEGFTFNDVEVSEKISPSTAVFKDDTNMFSSEFRESFDFLSLIMAIQ